MRIALGLEYDGTAYNGWQRQRTGIGVQARVEEALSSVANETIEVICAGRTDTGVHASGQVVHFDTHSERGSRGWMLGANSNLPAYMVLLSQGTGKNPGQPLFSRLWGNGYLPSTHQGVQLRPGSNPVLYLANPSGVNAKQRRKLLDDLAALNQQHAAEVGDPEIQARIESYEMAYRMQTSVPELTDFSDEPQHVLDLYGPDVAKPGSFTANCLLARRMAERDVRFIQLFHRGWDQHVRIREMLPRQCNDVDQASAALVKDLKMRGLLVLT